MKDTGQLTPTLLCRAIDSGTVAHLEIALFARLASPVVAAVPTSPDTLPNIPVTDIAPDRGDLADNLMAWYNGESPTEAVILGVHVRVAHPASFDLDQQLVGAGELQRRILHRQGMAQFFEDSAFVGLWERHVALMWRTICRK